MEIKNNYLYVNDILDTDEKAIPKELLEQYPFTQRGKVFSGIFGTFNAKEFEKAMRRD